MEDPEIIVVCMDCSFRAYHEHNYRPQFDAIKYYCKAKLKANSKTKVALFTMGEASLGCVVPPTSDFQEIRDSLQRIFYRSSEVLCLKGAVSHCRVYFGNCAPNMQKRMLFLTGSLVDMCGMDAVKYGLILKGLGIAVDVVNFYLKEKPKNKEIAELLDLGIKGGFKSTRVQLDAFVEAAKSNDNSHIEHVEPGSSIPEVLCKSILRKTPCFSTKTNHHKKATHAAGDNKRVRSDAKLGKRKREAIYLENEGAKLGKRKREAIYLENEGRSWARGRGRQSI